MTYEELSEPYRTRTMPNSNDWTKRNPFYQPVYPSIKEALEAKERVSKKQRTPEYDYIFNKICKEVSWYQKPLKTI